MSDVTTQRAAVTRRAFLRGAAALGLGAAAVPWSAAPAEAASPRLQLGFSVNSGILWESPASRSASLDAIRAMGAIAIRVDILWYWIEQQRGTYDWSLFDGVVDLALSKGLAVLGVVGSTPPWAALGGSTSLVTRPASAAAYGQFARAVAEHYRGRVWMLELWNEPNGREFFAPDPDPEFYASMVRAASTAIKQANPSAYVIAGALGPTPHGDGFIPAVPFTQRMLAAGIGSSVDAFSFHPYDPPQTMAEAAYWDHTAIRNVMDVAALLRAAGLGHLPIWATEYGVPINVRGEAWQAESLVRCMTEWTEMSYAGPMFIHHHKDQWAGDPYGLHTSALVPRPAVAAVTSTMAAGVPERPVAAGFRANADPALGAALSPVYAVGAGFAQEHERGSRFRAGDAYWSTTPAAGRVLRIAGLLPTGPTVESRQEVSLAGGGQVWTTPRGEAFVVPNGFVAAWVPALGWPVGPQELATIGSEQGTRQRFEGGAISWAHLQGVVVSLA